ncbi:MAG: type II toxin-antitoxin system MqsA family antitoxin [Gammaproteobacteria bacterium]|nr:type II toxin-antitoxin system MqsA family antitoxin [Gammaproteobacteria bacterium]MCY4219476.1 type II toxin-antitoxin system MqsA family antitoxin [Gammaproteobacteria bacterium]MCY4274727.1 type II toxin-antitoxin system MqsA family antitoxin [Gammaproteobacteria bacterium]
MNTEQSTQHSQAEQQENTCPMCGTDRTITKWNPLVFNYGSGKTMVELSVRVPVRRCDACDFEYLDEESEHIKHNAVCQHLGVLTPTEIRGIRGQFDMTRAQFSQLTGIGEASLNRWENGLSIQSYAYDRYLRLVTVPNNSNYLEKFLSPVNPSTTNLAGGKFRAIEITDHMQKQQQDFQLRKAA